MGIFQEDQEHLNERRKIHNKCPNFTGIFSTKSIKHHRKVYKDISNDHFTYDEQRQIEPYVKIHSKLNEDYFKFNKFALREPLRSLFDANGTN